MPAHALGTPRPRPPAKARRTPMKRSSTPPPAYDPTFTFLTSEKGGHTVPTTLPAGNWDNDVPAISDPALADDLSWLNDKSRDELTHLLVKADTLIKERENELSLTSTACKMLYENNFSLKAKHEALLARLPVSPAVPDMGLTRSGSPTPSIRSPLPRKLSFDRATPDAIESSTSPDVFTRPRRRFSVTTADISFLADQNAELLSKLEKLEAEANTADLAGRRELKRLEKELTFLKEELEKTQARSNEIEQQAKKRAEKSFEDMLKRKEEREARISALKKTSRGEGTGSTFLDFAPEGRILHSRSSRSQSSTNLDQSPLLDEASTPREDSAMIQETGSVPRDRDLIGKLLQKIQELESTNTRILEQQTETTTRLQAVQKETELMTKIYERLSESKEDDENAGVDVQLSDNLAGKSQSQFLTAKVSRQRSFFRPAPKPHARPSIMGIVDDAHTATISSPIVATSNSTRLPGNLEGRPQYTFPMNNGLVSPALSSLGLFSPPTRAFDEYSPNMASLPNLANELGEDWAINSDRSHQRDTSLSGFSQLSPSRTPHSNFPTGSDFDQHNEIDAPPTPQSILHRNSLQLSIELATPQRNLSVTQHESMLIGNMSPRFRAAQNLRSRNRYADTLGSALVRQRSFLGLSSTPSNVPAGGGLLLDAFNVMMNEFDERSRIDHHEDSSDISRSPSPEVEERNDEHGNENGPEGNLLKVQSNELTNSRFGSIMVEVWMWLQFAIIVLVFLWAIARRGPKSVLRDAERKRTISMKRRT